MSLKHVRPTDEGLLIVGHGTRDKVGQQQFLEVAQSVARRMSTVRVLPAFLELARPSISEAVDAAAEQGVRRLGVVPLLLFAAGHAKTDIPRTLAAAAARHQGLETHLYSHLGCHPRIVELSALRFDQSISRWPNSALDDTALVMVGRGSRDEEATAEMIHFTKLRAELTPASHVETCFAAMAKPSLEETLARVADLPTRYVVVEPHLLFSGDLLSRIEDVGNRIGRTNLRQQWVVTAPLGPHELLTQAISEIRGTK